MLDDLKVENGEISCNFDKVSHVWKGNDESGNPMYAVHFISGYKYKITKEIFEDLKSKMKKGPVARRRL